MIRLNNKEFEFKVEIHLIKTILI